MYIDKLLLWAWKNIKPLMVWSSWILLTLVLSISLTNTLQGKDKSQFLPGSTTDGHYQIEIACEVCHTKSFEEVKQEACVECHGAELEAVDDSHPDHKFSDPRNADLLTSIDAQKCVTCHGEHRPAMTRPLGVTVPPDYCVHCHKDIAEDRPSHEGMPFDTCRGACHNYHDNKALYEDFLLKHLNEQDTFNNTKTIKRDFMAFYQLDPKYPVKVLTMAENDAPKGVDLKNAHDWEGSSHANAGVNCMACHTVDKVWVDKPDHTVCKNCHALEVSGFLAGRHGMRLASDLSAMTVDMARQPMKANVHKELNCMSCHKSHQYDTDRVEIAVNACLGCHDDDHSRAYKNSPHFRLLNQEMKGKMPKGTGASCATCHLPREITDEAGNKRTLVQHNQNLNLRPRQKMARGVCMNCHGLAFTLDALADESLVTNNYSALPSSHIESLDMAEKRLGKK